MLGKVSFAVLVMTGEDEAEGERCGLDKTSFMKLGLFQGHLGFFTKAIVLWRKILRNFRTFQGVHQIRYAKGNIKETFGDVLATLRSEFG